MAAKFIYRPGGDRDTETQKTNDLALEFSAVLKGSLFSLLPMAVRVAVHGPELTQLLWGK